jgi:hypothetical protein
MGEEVLALVEYTQFVRDMDPNLEMTLGYENIYPIVTFKLDNIEQSFRMDSGNNLPKFVMDMYRKFMKDLAYNHISNPNVQEAVFGR